MDKDAPTSPMSSLSGQSGRRSSLCRASASVKLSNGGVDRIAETLACPICLDVAQLPVNIICFQGCGGTQSRGNTCLRSLVCQHCANQALELHKPAASRFTSSSGFARCIICRDTCVPAASLTPDKAYMTNFNIMDVMDVLGVRGICRPCDEEFDSQVELQAHYLWRCAHAIVRCRFKGCSTYGLRTDVAAHEEVCSVGRARCGQCLQYLDQGDLLPHMVASCRNRVVGCVLCTHRAPLPAMLEHLKLHQVQLLSAHQQQQQQQRGGRNGSAGDGSSRVAAAGPLPTAGPRGGSVGGGVFSPSHHQHRFIDSGIVVGAFEGGGTALGAGAEAHPTHGPRSTAASAAGTEEAAASETVPARRSARSPSAASAAPAQGSASSSPLPAVLPTLAAPPSGTATGHIEGPRLTEARSRPIDALSDIGLTDALAAAGGADTQVVVLAPVEQHSAVLRTRSDLTSFCSMASQAAGTSEGIGALAAGAPGQRGFTDVGRTAYVHGRGSTSGLFSLQGEVVEPPRTGHDPQVVAPTTAVQLPGANQDARHSSGASAAERSGSHADGELGGLLHHSAGAWRTPYVRGRRSTSGIMGLHEDGIGPSGSGLAAVQGAAAAVPDLDPQMPHVGGETQEGARHRTEMPSIGMVVPLQFSGPNTVLAQDLEQRCGVHTCLAGGDDPCATSGQARACNPAGRSNQAGGRDQAGSCNEVGAVPAEGLSSLAKVEPQAADSAGAATAPEGATTEPLGAHGADAGARLSQAGAALGQLGSLDQAVARDQAGAASLEGLVLLMDADEVLTEVEQPSASGLRGPVRGGSPGSHQPPVHHPTATPQATPQAVQPDLTAMAASSARQVGGVGALCGVHCGGTGGVNGDAKK